MQLKLRNGMITVIFALCIPACILPVLFEVSLPYMSDMFLYAMFFNDVLTNLSSQCVYVILHVNHFMYDLLMGQTWPN